ncbi:MAG TPA: hypothetical protein VMK12_29355 [Anaeromyxobacteraceae bacterium]|nr:hypothetical protein [Anaeromyxobacteraceae bacterium]
MADKAPSSFSLFIDEALSGWLAPVAGLALVVTVGLLYLAGVASEQATASLLISGVSLAAGLYVVRPALDRRRDVGTRVLVLGAAVATVVGTALPALRTVRPGDVLFAGELSQVDASIPVPPGISGRVRLLISGKLPEGGEPSMAFVISGTKEAVEGKLERTFNYARVGRSGRTRVAHDHTADFYPAEVAPDAGRLKLERVQGQLESPLAVAAFSEPIPLAGGPWILAALAILLAACADARLAQKSESSVAAGMAVAFGLLITYNATPGAAVGPAVGGVILGAITGSLVGWMASFLAGRLVPAATRKPTPGTKAASAA